MTSQPKPGEVLNGESEYERAVMFATRDKPSCSYIQRRMQLTYSRAAALMERMEAEGLISASNSAGKRTIIVPFVERPLQPSGGQDGGGELRERVGLALRQAKTTWMADIVLGSANTKEAAFAIGLDAILQALASPAKVTGWQGIETHDGSRRPEVLLIGLYPDGVTWSDVYHGWRQPPYAHDGEFGIEQLPGAWARWPHKFPPTHFQPVVTPPRPEDEGAA